MSIDTTPSSAPSKSNDSHETGQILAFIKDYTVAMTL